MTIPLRDRPHTVYVLRGSAGEPLYVGCTSNFERRMKAIPFDARQHTHTKREWIHLVDSAHTYTEIAPSLAAGQTRETELIALLSPMYNVMRRSRIERPIEKPRGLAFQKAREVALLSTGLDLDDWIRAQRPDTCWWDLGLLLRSLGAPVNETGLRSWARWYGIDTSRGAPAGEDDVA